ncbi:hypothetical protein ACFPRL_28805 [Pseudoclavibacter helvolus]
MPHAVRPSLTRSGSRGLRVAVQQLRDRWAAAPSPAEHVGRPLECVEPCTLAESSTPGQDPECLQQPDLGLSGFLG